MIPHERSLVEKLKDKSFALIGVNTDQSVDFFKKEAVKLPTTWRSFYDGQQGQICTSWSIHSFPSIFIIDAKGVLRFRDLRGEEMETAVEKLLAEAEAEKKS